MKVEIELKGMDGVLATLQALPKEIVSKRGGPVKLALAKGARYLRDRVRENLVASMNNDDDYKNTGLLVQSVISSRGKPLIGGNGERYLVRVKRKSYPKKGGETVTTLKTMHLKEYGSSQQPATPTLRPAIRTHGEKVIDIVSADLLKRVDKVVKDLARKNKGRG